MATTTVSGYDEATAASRVDYVRHSRLNFIIGENFLGNFW